MPDPLSVLLNLQQQDPTLSVPSRPLDYNRNNAKVAMLRRYLGIPGEDVGDISQQDYEEAAADVERRRNEELQAQASARILPEVVRGEYGVKAAGVRAQAGSEERRQQQARQHEFLGEQNALNRQAAGERMEQRMETMLPTLDPTTGIATYTPRAEAAGMRIGGGVGEREAIQGGQNTLDNVGMLLKMGEDIGWKGIGPAGGVKNTMYKYLGMGDPREDDFRSALQKVRADIMFGAGGKQLTTSEQKVAAGYLTDIYTNPTAAKSRLIEIQNMLGRAQGRRIGQPITGTGQSSDWEDVGQR